MNENIKIMPVVALRGLVLFPDMTLHFDVGRKTSIAAIKAAMNAQEDVFFVSQLDITQENPAVSDLCSIGVTGTIRQVVRIPGNGGTLRVIADGRQRGKINELLQVNPFMSAKVELLEENPDRLTTEADSIYSKALIHRVHDIFGEFIEHVPQLTRDVTGRIYSIKDPGALADAIAGNVLSSLEDKQELLCIPDPINRLERLCILLAEETEILTLDESINEMVTESLDKNQREYYLREQLRIISEELDGPDAPEDAESLIDKVNKSAMSEESKKKLLTECGRLKRLSPSSPDANVLQTYIEKCLEIPWGKYSKETSKLQKAVKTLEHDHYGLKDVKDRITEMIAALMISPDIKGQIICLAGPPGVGKTSVAKSIAAATGRKYTRISLGGVRDEAEIRGHRRTYIGAIPGRIINALTEAGTLNPLILLDEVDKLSGDFKGDPASALLEVLDGEQNFAFRDHYIELPVDLSKVLFITTANDKYAIPDALRDRMEIIDLPSYTYEEKFQIAKRHLVPKQMKQHSLTKSNIKITDDALRKLIDGYTREAGVRILERKIAALCRKSALRIAEGNSSVLSVTPSSLEGLLGQAKYRDENETENEVGAVNGLAWTSVGGELLKVEVLVMEGTGKLELTGSLGDVMKESARAAVSFIRSKAAEFGIDGDFYKNKDIHIHFPEGAVPKDGPSAGVTVTTALVSALTGRPVNGKIAMTGEVTLRGKVLAIGGLKEKSMAAYRAGIGTVIIPSANVPDVSEIDEEVRSRITFIPVKTAEEVIELAVLPAQPEKRAGTEKYAVVPQYAHERGAAGELQ